MAEMKPALSLRAHEIFYLALDAAKTARGFSHPTTDYFALQLVGHGPFIAEADKRLFQIKASYDRVAKAGKSTIDDLAAARKTHESERANLVIDLARRFGGQESAAKLSEPLPAEV